MLGDGESEMRTQEQMKNGEHWESVGWWRQTDWDEVRVCRRPTEGYIFVCWVANHSRVPMVSPRGEVHPCLRPDNVSGNFPASRAGG
jgi:hypothetical protein